MPPRMTRQFADQLQIELAAPALLGNVFCVVSLPHSPRERSLRQTRGDSPKGGNLILIVRVFSKTNRVT